MMALRPASPTTSTGSELFTRYDAKFHGSTLCRCKHKPQQPAADGEQHTLHQNLADEPGGRSAERTAHGQLEGARLSADEHQVGDVNRPCQFVCDICSLCDTIRFSFFIFRYPFLMTPSTSATDQSVMRVWRGESLQQQR